MMIHIENLKGHNLIEYSRNEKGELQSKLVSNFYPYFYAPTNKESKIKSIFGDNLKKITLDHPGKVKQQRETYKKHFEADVRFVNRYIIDKYHNKEIPKQPIRMCYIDIEVDYDDKFPNPEEANCPINCITVYDSFTNEYKTFTTVPNSLVLHYQDEDMLLTDFLFHLHEINPDLLIAWNGEGFDFPYILTRLNKKRLNTSLFGRLTGTCIKTDSFGTKIYAPGRVLFDLLKAYKKISQNERESYALEYVSQYEIGEGKEKYEGDLKDLHIADPDKFIKYNIRDVELMVIINEKLKIVDFFDEVRRFAKCTFEDVFWNSRVIDSLSLSRCHNKFVFPSKQQNKSETFEGGFVIQPEPGRFKNVMVADLASLYPSIMMSLNLSPETFLSKPEEGCINIDNKFYFKHPDKQKGYVSGILEELLQKRKKYKKEMAQHKKGTQKYNTLDMLQYTVKIIMNSFFGVLGNRFFRMYKHEIASCITYVGRNIIQYTKTKLEELEGVKVIYGDTDSVFITYTQDKYTPTEIIKYIESSYKDFAQMFNIKLHKFNIELEKEFDILFFTGAKKRYSGLKKDGDLIIVGFENRRSDSPQVIRDFQKDLLNNILLEKSKEEIDGFILRFYNEFTYLRETIGIPMMLKRQFSEYKNTPIHVRASKISNEKHGTNFGKGDKVKWVYVKHEDKKKNVIGFMNQIPEDYEIDYERMAQRLIINLVNRFYNGLGWEEFSLKQQEEYLQQTLC